MLADTLQGAHSAGFAHFTTTLPFWGAGVDEVVVNVLDRGEVPFWVWFGTIFALLMLVVQLRMGQMPFGTPAMVQFARKSAVSPGKNISP